MEADEASIVACSWATVGCIREIASSLSLPGCNWRWWTFPGVNSAAAFDPFAALLVWFLMSRQC
ncbi:uncharacterized protein BDW70DRAFT_128706 [Aspergillus foveolatus]|uniref:uncharacterized protein n=1 Tax=Aspergillus foveolatus TaxID=210207 RepID=UPI003CCDE990